MVKRILAAGALTLAGLAACERTPTGPGTGTRIDFELTLPPLEAAAAQQTVELGLIVTGPDMDRIRERQVVETDTDSTGALRAQLSVAVPPGRQRHFEVYLLAVTGTTTHFGETTVDIDPAGEALRLPLTLQPQPLIRVVLAHYITDFRDDTLFNEWMLNHVVSLGYRVEFDRTSYKLVDALRGADLLIIPMPSTDFGYTVQDSLDLIDFIQTGGMRVLFLGDDVQADFMPQLTTGLGFRFEYPVGDSVQFVSETWFPLITDFPAPSFWPAGDTLLYQQGLECRPVPTNLPVVLNTLATLSPDGYALVDGPVPAGPVALFGTLGIGKFVAVGELDWLGPTGTLATRQGIPLPVGIGSWQHAELATAILRWLAPVRSFPAN